MHPGRSLAGLEGEVQPGKCRAGARRSQDRRSQGGHPQGHNRRRPDGNGGVRIVNLPVTGASVEDAELELGVPRGVQITVLVA